MGSVPFSGEDESQPITSNGKSCKLSTTLLDGCDGVNHASIPRKLRSAIKKRGRESIISPLLISKKPRHVSNTVGTLKKDGAKQSKLNLKKGRHITKDEEEVAETLYALASFFSDANKADQPTLDDEKPEIKSSATLGEESSISAAKDTCPTLKEEDRKMSSKVTLKAVFPSSKLVTSTAEEIKSPRLKAPHAYGGLSESSPSSSSRPLASILGMNHNGEHEIRLDQVIQCRENFSSIGDVGLFLSPNTTGATSSKTHKSCPHAKIHSWFGRTDFSSQPGAIEKKVITEEHTKGAPESNVWKRCSAHVYISRLVKILQISGRKEESPLQPTESTGCGGTEQQSNLSIHNQMARINGRNVDAYFSGIDHYAAKKDSSDIQKNILLDKRPIQDQKMGSETSALCSAKQGYDFLSLGSGIGGLDTGKSANGAGCFRQPPQEFHMPYLQSQNHSMLYSLPHNGYSSFHGHNSALPASPVQLPQQHNRSVNFRGRRAQQQQKWAAQLHNKGGAPPSPDRRDGVDSAAMLNYAHSLFPHLHAALAPNYHQLSPSQHPINSNITRLHHNLPLGLQKNAAAYRLENMAQLQLP